MEKKVFCGCRAKNAASSALLCPAANASGKRVRMMNLLWLKGGAMTPALSAAGWFSGLSGISQVRKISRITHSFLSR